MRLMLLTSARRWGGTTLTYARLARELARRGHAVSVLARSGDLAARFAATRIPAPAGARALGAWRQVRRAAPDALLADLPRDLGIAAPPGLGAAARRRVATRLPFGRMVDGIEAALHAAGGRFANVI
jgi:hypothetical protein